MARALQLLLLSLALPATAAAAPQLDLPKARREAPAKRKPAPAKKPGTGTAGPAEGAPPAAGQDAAKPGAKDVSPRGDVVGGNAGTTEKVEPILGPDGRPVGTRTTVGVNVPGAGNGSNDIGVESTPPDGPARLHGDLSLPSSRRRTGAAAEPGAAVEEPVPAPDEAVIDPFDPVTDGRGAARALYAELVRQRRITDDTVSQIADRLARLGPDGLQVARFALQQEEAPVAFAGARALLLGGDGADADRVVRLLRGDVPPKAAAAILDEVIERDPVRASNALLCALCSHDDKLVRRAARRALAPRIRPEDLPDLAPAFEARQTEARRGALELIARMDSPAAIDALLMSVSDRSTSVAAVAIEALARSEDPRIDLELRRQAFAKGLIGRSEALALLALVEREDRATRPLIGDESVEPLMDAFRSPVPLVSNVAAVALAGIGFRSPRVSETGWLDDSVPSALVGIAAGVRYFEGFDVVREPALRRLRQIAGITHGNDGPAWSRWWALEKVGFRASRAVIEVTPADAARLVVMTQDPAVGPPILLAGAALAEDEEWLAAQQSEPLFLPAGDAAALMDLLQQEGVFDFERLPGPRGAIGLRGRSFEVSVGVRKKSFRFAEGMSRAWFSRVLTRVVALDQQLAWQRYLVAGAHERPRDLFLQEREWWEAHPAEADRVARVEELAMAHVVSVSPARRAPALEDLIALDDAHGTAGPEDAARLLELLADGTIFGETERALTELCLRAADLQGRAGTEPVSDEQRAAARALISTLRDTYGVLARSEIERVLGALDHADLLEAARDQRGLLRVAAAGVMGSREPSMDVVVRAEDTEVLVGLALDEEEEVQVAAIRALPGYDPVRARPMLLDRASRGRGAVRAAALEALGDVEGSSDVVQVLIAGLTDPEARYHLPAARGLGNLGTPETAPLLVSLLRATTKPALRAEARAGLRRMGGAARLDLVSAMRSPDRGLRREAALLLSHLAEPRSVPVLARLAVEDPQDEEILEELAVLTCVDYRTLDVPSDGYYRFWDEAEQRDAFAWFVAALERRRLRAPDRAAFEGQGSAEAREFLVALLAEFDEGDPLRERARRELERLIGEPIGRVPAEERAKLEWLQGLLTRGERAARRGAARDAIEAGR